MACAPAVRHSAAAGGILGIAVCRARVQLLVCLTRGALGCNL
jgi:hypothetical protein